MAKRRRLILFVALAGLALAVVALFAWRSAVSDPVERRITIRLPSPALRARPLRLALVSDIHLPATAMTPDRLDRIVAQINRARPDAILLAGDFVNGRDPRDAAFRPDLLTAPLARLRAPLGVYAVPGNHDHWTDVDRVTAALQAAGITVLANDARALGPITLVGIDDDLTGHADVDTAMQLARDAGSGIPIAITHTPDIAPTLPPDVPLMLAGHTHCGQIVLPVLGSLALLSPFDDRRPFDPHYRCGVIADPGRTVIVTAGVGAGEVPFRLGAPPDWWMVTLAGR